MKKLMVSGFFGVLLVVSGLVYANVPVGPGPTNAYKYGTGPVVAECLHNGQTYAARSANGICPGYHVHMCSVLHECTSDHDEGDPNCINSENVFNFGD